MTLTAPLRALIGRLAQIGFAVLSVWDSLRCRIFKSTHRHIATPAARNAILVVRTEAKLGDALLHVPFLRELRRKFPTHAIHFVHHEGARQVYAACPYIDRRIEISWNTSSAASVLKRLRLCSAVFSTQTDPVAYDVGFSSRWDEDLFAPFILWFSGAKERVSFSSRSNPRRSMRNFGIDMLMTRAVLDVEVHHESARSLLLLNEGSRPEKFLPLDFWWSEADSLLALSKLAPQLARCRRLVALSPGAASGRRRWPPARFGEALQRIREQTECEFVVLGSSAEIAECAEICTLSGLEHSSNLAGKLSIPECAALLSRALLFIGNDSGLIHVACAAGTDVVQVSCHPATGDPNHPNSPRRFGPSTDGSAVVQPKVPAGIDCNAGCISDEPHCILGVDVLTVVAAAVECINRAASLRP